MTSERLFSLPNLDKLVDEIFVRLQHLQQARELRASVIKFFGGVFGLALQPLPLIDQELPLLWPEALFLRQCLKLGADMIQCL